MRRARTLQEAVEFQAGRCRQAAIALDTYAENHRRLDRNVVAAHARTFQEVADGLTKALADGDIGKLKQMWRWSRMLAAPLLIAGAAGASQAYTAEAIDDDDIRRCVLAVEEGAKADAHIVEEAGPLAPAVGATEMPITFGLAAAGQAPLPSEVETSVAGSHHHRTISDGVRLTDDTFAQAETATAVGTAEDATVIAHPPRQVVNVGMAHETDIAHAITPSVPDRAG